MADVGTTTLDETGHRRDNGLLRFTLNWLSDSNGDVTFENISRIVGTIEKIVFSPGGASGAGPTDNYDATLLDEDGEDVLRGKGADLDTADNRVVTVTGDTLTNLVLPFATAGILTLTIANAGDTKTGQIHIFLRR